MSVDRRETRRARKIKAALDIPYTKALRIYRANQETFDWDWDTITDEQLQQGFGDKK